MTVQTPDPLLPVEEYHRMIEAGILTEDDRVELIEGQLLKIAPITPRHASCVTRLNRLIVLAVKDRAIVSVQNPVELGEWSEPEPDLALARPRNDFYSEGHPARSEIFLLVEVTDSSHEYDRYKISVYAHHGVPETWQVNVEQQTVTVHRTPSAEGYRSVTTAAPGDTLSPAAFPDLEIPVNEILGS